MLNYYSFLNLGAWSPPPWVACARASNSTRAYAPRPAAGRALPKMVLHVPPNRLQTVT